ncbi:MAG: septal ring lytic transglycosylase RlpA family protein [Variibacter sp.]
MGRKPVRVWRIAEIGAMLAGCLALGACASGGKLASTVDPRYGVSASPRVVEPGQPVPKGGGTYRVGKPYVVGGRLYTPEENRHYRAEGIASWYGDDFHGRLTANGEVYDMGAISAAHPTLPIPSYARVTNLKNGRSIIVRVNDRGPYHSNRLIDLSYKAANLLEFRGHGLARVRVEYVGSAPLEGTDDRMLMATLREGAPAPAPSNVMIASARPFVPHSRVPIAEVPVPSSRPYDLGENDGRGASESWNLRTTRRQGSASEMTARARIAPPPAPPAPQIAARRSPPPSVAAASALPMDGAGLGFSNGRGLY